MPRARRGPFLSGDAPASNHPVVAVICGTQLQWQKFCRNILQFHIPEFFSDTTLIASGKRYVYVGNPETLMALGTNTEIVYASGFERHPYWPELKRIIKIIEEGK